MITESKSEVYDYNFYLNKNQYHLWISFRNKHLNGINITNILNVNDEVDYKELLDIVFKTVEKIKRENHDTQR